MKNRKASSPILCAVALSLAVSPAFASSNPESDLPLPAKSAPAAATSASASTQTTSARPATYTVVAGDTLTAIAKKFGTTSKKLKKLNNLATKTLKPGQVLLIPPATVASTAKPVKTTAKAKTPVTPAVKTASAQPKKEVKKEETTYPQAQPVQDFDIPASTFASCPVPQSTPETDAEAQDEAASARQSDSKPAPVAKLVSPTELTKDETPKPSATTETTEPETRTTDTEPADNTFTRHSSKNASSPAYADIPSAPAPYTPPVPKLTSRTPNPTITMPSSDWGNRFLQQARALADRGIEYDEDWRPPGESRAWTMDCSNTSRYLYKVTTGIQLPRTASDQYYYLHLQNKAWDVPQAADGWADTNFLRQNLKPGDLLFWENTYRPERQPPITHVMVFLGTNDKGQWIMAGSQSSRGGEHNRANGGPDIYIFNPCKPCGGYTTWLGLVHHQGRFCAFGRPLEADKSKLSVAAND